MKKLLYIFLGLSLTFGCSDDTDNDSNVPCLSQPTLQTNPVTQIENGGITDMVSVTLNGEIVNNPIGVNCETLSITSQGFVWATNTLPTIEDESVAASGININASISNLNNENVYYVRTYLTNTLGTFYGNEVSFETPESPSAVYLDENGVTIKAKDWGQVGDSGVVNGIEYTIVDIEMLLSMILNDEDLSKVCTTKITSLLIDGFDNDDQDNVVDGLFEETDFNQDISSWDVSNITNMYLLFKDNPSFNQNISYWNTGSLTSLYLVFSGASSFNQDISGWDTSNVTEFAGTFWNASSFNQDLSGWDTVNTEYCEVFSEGATSWTLPKPTFPIVCD